MTNINSLNELISFNDDFRTSVNLYLSLNKPEKIRSYIPTKSSTAILNDYLNSVINNKEQATMLVGPYGKGKSHLLLILLSILSLDRDKDENTKLVNDLINKISISEGEGSDVVNSITNIWNNYDRFLPVLVQDTKDDLQQNFVFALNEALNRAGIVDLIPYTSFDYALSRITYWKDNYPSNYNQFVELIKELGYSESKFIKALREYSRKELDSFIDIYPSITAGSRFDPLIADDVVDLYKSVSDRLKEEYGYSGIYIVFDEFSKFIEGQKPEYIGKNMKVLQNICELSMESKDSRIFTTLIAHKSIKEYGNYLSPEIINLFTGIEGRLVEKYFITSTKNNYELIRHAIVKTDEEITRFKKTSKYVSEEYFEKYYSLPCFKSVFNEVDFNSIVLKGCYPLNPLSAYCLLNISEKIAQNERTLFTFISNDEPCSMARYIHYHTEDQSWTIGLDLIYDYFSSLFKKEVINEFVHSEWLNAEYALTKCKSFDQERIVKSIALISIINKQDELPVVDECIKMATEISDYSATIDELIKNKIIYKRGIDGTYAFKTRAGSALKKEIRNRREFKGSNVNYGNVFNSILQNRYLIPRKYNSIHKMTRFFVNEYMDINSFLNLDNAESLFDEVPFCDGVVINLYSFDKINELEIRKKIREINDHRIIIIVPEKTIGSNKQIIDYEIIQDLKDSDFIINNEVMSKELPIQEVELSREIEKDLNEVYSKDSKVLYWYTEDKNLKTERINKCEEIVGKICENIYYLTPMINNEIINREKITTGPTKKTRSIIVRTILSHQDDESFYTGSNQEATIARALIKNTGLMEDDTDNAVSIIIHLIDEFFDSCCDKKNELNKLVDVITAAPYGMRRGSLPVYIAYVLSKRHEDIVVYFNDVEIQLNEEIIINMCESPEDYSIFISRADVEKEKYISELNDLFEVNSSINLTENRIKNIVLCMQRKFRALPQVARNLPCIDEYDAAEDSIKSMMILYKKLIQRINPNPYQFLFDELPDSFNSKEDLAGTFDVLTQVITAFDDYRDWMIRKAAIGSKNLFTKKKEELVYSLKRWYDKQSIASKQEILDRRATNFMNCIKELDVYSDEEVVSKLVKAVTDIYIENWNYNSYEDYISELSNCKNLVESIKDNDSSDKMELKYVNAKGEDVTLFYQQTNEGQGNILKNILEDTLDEYSDLSVNDRVAILVEIIDKIVRK